MKKKTLYEKLIEVEPFVRKYHEVVHISAMSEDDYVELKCVTSRVCMDADSLIPKPDEKKHKTIIKVLFGATALGAILVVLGLIRLISTSGDLGGMGAAYGIALLVASFVLRPRLAAKYNKELAMYEQQQEKINEYNAAKEVAREKYRSLVETKDSVIDAAKAKLKELNLEEEAFLAEDYYLSDDNWFGSMLDYAKQHPTHTTLRGYLNEKREIEQILRAVERDSTSYYEEEDDPLEEILRQDREKRFQHDCEMARQEEERRRDERIRENMERERREREEWLRESAEKRERQRKEREERDAQRKRERDALSKCSHCVNSAKCSITTKYNSLTCGAYRPI